ncbi:FAD-dependent oxidoreductase [Microbacterium sediminis]|uniref:FAD-dependent oxidoreductase n=1 Tax=Microbacterium sediminis TaxID=904291 RepID=UPI0010728DCB|nr:FAD-dependent oxidoreductase [Microbacterium sediminis]QBR73742.1 FAD-binding protein [Microbacterium sediminis]
MESQEFDVVVVGSGAAGLATALGAIDEGLSVLVIESTERWAGSTGMSGGGLWLPNNPLMRRDGVGDSREEALEYLARTVGDGERSASPERRAAFVDGVDDYVTTAERYGVRFLRSKDYPDYYPELPGGKIGRALESRPFDAKRLGELARTQRVSMPLPMLTDDLWQLQRSWVTFDGFLRGVRFAFRVLGGLVRGKRLTGIGGSLTASLGHAVFVQGKVPLWLSSPARRLITEGDRVVGVEVEREGATVIVRARRGVMLASGGFDHHREWRLRYHGIAGNPAGNPGGLGQGHELAREVGAAFELMDDAWWGAAVKPIRGGSAGFMVGERALPYQLIVDAQGRRFANEAESYVDLGHHMLEHDRGGRFWQIGDARYARRYLRTFAVDPRVNKAMTAEGIRVTADTIEELAPRIGMDTAVLRETVDRFNGFARSGKDQDFHRGDSAYDRYYGDPTVRPNPCLGPLEKGPFTAYEMVVGDLGTKGGVVTDTHARALREDGTVIEGLYAAGNVSAAVMGRTYPGPGSTIGPASVFGLIAARTMARG